MSKQIGTGAVIFNVYDGWELIKEYQGATVSAAYLSGPGGLIKNLLSNNYYYQDASGELAAANGSE